jgi:hypothetical protein
MSRIFLGRSKASFFRTAALGVVLVLASCATPQLQTTAKQNPDISPSNYQTFAWIAEEPLVGKRGRLSERNKKRIENTIVETLTDKGYEFISSPTEADFVVSYTRGTRKSLTKSSYPGTYHAGWSWNQPMTADYRDMSSDRVAYTSTSEQTVYTESSLAIDIFDVQAHELAWHGFGHKELTGDDRRDPEELLADVIQGIFKPFPRRK